jgi:hypothetical protein
VQPHALRAQLAHLLYSAGASPLHLGLMHNCSGDFLNCHGRLFDNQNAFLQWRAWHKRAARLQWLLLAGRPR